MRVVGLLIVFVTLMIKFYPFKKGNEADSVKIKLSALRRVQPEVAPKALSRSPAIVQENKNEPAVSSSENTEQAPEKDEPELGTIAGWNAELKEFLQTMEPEEGEEMYNAYIAERQTYKNEFNSLANERANLFAGEDGKPDKKLYRKNRELIEEFDTVMAQLEMKHAEKLKDVLGAHYDPVMEMQGQYDDSITDEAAEALAESSEAEPQSDSEN